MNGNGTMNNLTIASPTPGSSIIDALLRVPPAVIPTLLSLAQALVSTQQVAVAEEPVAEEPVAEEPVADAVVEGPADVAVVDGSPSQVAADEAEQATPAIAEREPAIYSSVKRTREEVYERAPVEPAKRARSAAVVALNPATAAPVPAPLQPMPAHVQPVPAHPVQIRPAEIPREMRQEMDNATFCKLNSTDREYVIAQMVMRNGFEPEEFSAQGIKSKQRQIAAIPAKMLELYELQKTKAKRAELAEWAMQMREIHK